MFFGQVLGHLPESLTREDSVTKKPFDWLRSASVGPHFLVCIAIGTFLGLKLDERFETEPILLIVFMFFGIAAGFVNLFRELAVVNREEEQRGDQPVQNESDHESLP